ncbi:thiamine pyrophosphate-dependent enzyme [Heliophilum fasciatum]|uniref:Pyruvate ferredoxin oxidoreductase beta subunit n=1 Tax=Heliophilum fasciatum TaxID=35700 RepID=A0A4V2SY53_9FIRM|nr:thiamine pyrophosphate-dependent enzyme [Heliophilum fasciatum]MCW2276823.1 pyruvate ferredoxin oxidoreductase beta subunit [Heliophilum fasciatum]TCP68716.1 pyruvate ferredoxin oxidoreductase beta subunit [Heliophilum fasciatum]
MNNAVFSSRNMTEQEFFFGHKACAGCGGALAVRLALKVLGERTFAALPAGCMSAVGFIYPQMAFGINAIISTFAGTASMLAGMAAAARAQGLEDVHIVGFAGDGGTADIGIQALSGAIDRGERIIYICYDNEAYMNTGTQKSGLTPLGARTTTTPDGSVVGGSTTKKKNMFDIVAAHGIDYAATASIGYYQDYMNKVLRASQCGGTAYIHVMAPCPTGWGIPTEHALTIARESVDCGLWYLAEYSQGKYRLNQRPETFTPVEDYLRKQGRFKHLQSDDIAQAVRDRDARWQYMLTQWSDA